jgi:hypothetical protein
MPIDDLQFRGMQQRTRSPRVGGGHRHAGAAEDDVVERNRQLSRSPVHHLARQPQHREDEGWECRNSALPAGRSLTGTRDPSPPQSLVIPACHVSATFPLVDTGRQAER